MRIEYDAQDDILCIKFSSEPIVNDVSQGWNVNIGYAANGIEEITILDAKAAGYWPLESVRNADPYTWPAPPTPDAILAARVAAGLTQTKAGAVLYCHERTWQDWERGRRTMMPALFEHFLSRCSLSQKQ